MSVRKPRNQADIISTGKAYRDSFQYSHTEAQHMQAVNTTRTSSMLHCSWSTKCIARLPGWSCDPNLQNDNDDTDNTGFGNLLRSLLRP